MTTPFFCQAFANKFFKQTFGDFPDLLRTGQSNPKAIKKAGTDPTFKIGVPLAGWRFAI
jgi:hypothetical protein